MNKNYEDEIFEETEEAVADTGTKSEKLLRICLAAVIVAVVVIAILASVVITMSRSGDEEETTTIPVEETTTGAVELTTAPAEKYTTGQYTVNVGENGKLNLRKEPSKDGEQILAIDNGTLLTITEVKYDETADEDSQYWGRTLYKGWDAWVSMKYLANAYSENIVTPAEVTTAAAEEVTTAETAEATTAATSTETTTAAVVQETTTAATVQETTTSGASGVYSTGTYKVTAEPHLNMRDGHDVGALSIAQIPANAEITIVEVYHDADSTNEYTRYWGKTTFGGYTGWVAMGYLK